MDVTTPTVFFLRYLLEPVKACAHFLTPAGSRKRAKERLQRWMLGADAARFFEAVRDGDLAAVELFVKSGARADTRYDGNTALVYAAWCGQLDVVRFLIKKKADRTIRGTYGNTALMAAVRKDHDEIAELLRDPKAPRPADEERARFIRDAEEGMVERVRACARNPEIVNAQDVEGDTALICAARAGHAKVVEVLLEAGADPTVRGRLQKTASEAARLRHFDEIVHLLEERTGHAAGANEVDILEAASQGNTSELGHAIGQANVNATDLDGATPLILASRAGETDAVRVLVTSGRTDIAVNHRDDRGRTALLEAATCGYAAIVRLLLTHGADPEVADKEGDTPIRAAIRGGHLEVQRLLVAERGETDGERDARLIAAVESGDLEQVRLWLERKANVNARFLRGRTPLIAACEYGHAVIAKTLLKAGAELEEPDADGVTPLMASILFRREDVRVLLRRKGAWRGEELGHLIVAAEVGDGDTIRRILRGAKQLVNGRTRERRTALMVAAENGHSHAAGALIGNRADVHARDRSRRTALMIACEQGEPVVVRLLLDAKADVNARDRRKATPLILAAHTGNLEVTRRLLERPGLDRGATGWGHRTALMTAASQGHTSVVKALIAAGPADQIEARDSREQTALILAANGGHSGAVQALLMAGACADATDRAGRTALAAAISGDHIEVVRLLWRDHTETTPPHVRLIVAVRQGNLGLVKRLLDANDSLVDSRDRRGRTLLMLAIDHRMEEVASELARRGADPMARDNRNRPVLVAACEHGLSELITFLAPNANVNAEAKHRRSALLLACERANLKAVETLIEQGARYQHVIADDGRTPMMAAVLRSETAEDSEEREQGAWIAQLLRDLHATDGEEDARLLLAAGNGDQEGVARALSRDARIEATDNRKRTALFLAAKEGHDEIAKSLVEIGADPDVKDSAGDTPLVVAARRGHLEVIRALVDPTLPLRTDANLPCKGERTALMEAADKCPDKEVRAVVNALLGGNASVQRRAKSGATALLLAAKKGRTAVAKDLIEAGANVNARDVRGECALLFATYSGDAELVKALLAKQANPNVRNRGGHTPLMVASLAGHTDIEAALRDAKATAGEVDASLVRAIEIGLNYPETEVHHLLAAGASNTARNLDGDTVLILAAARGLIEVVRTLVADGAPVDGRGQHERTALHGAAAKGHHTIVRGLVDADADVNSRNKDGRTPLMEAACGGHASVIRVLLKSDADVNAHDSSGRSALDLARVHAREDVVKLLEPLVDPDYHVVYVTRYGRSFHLASCGHVRKRVRFPKLEEQARGEEYGQCTDCFR